MERRAYQGFSAVNTLIRLAAQTPSSSEVILPAY
jgi:hypothetical protein